MTDFSKSFICDESSKFSESRNLPTNYSCSKANAYLILGS
jgi:hypothetical protein